RPVLRARCSTAAAPVAGPAPSDRVGPSTVRLQWTVAHVRLSDLMSPFQRLWDRDSKRGSRLDEPERQDKGEECLQTGGDRGGRWTVLVAGYGPVPLPVDNAGCPPLASRPSPATDRAEDSSARPAGAARTVCSVPRNRPWELEALEHETSSWDSKAGPVRHVVPASSVMVRTMTAGTVVAT